MASVPLITTIKKMSERGRERGGGCDKVALLKLLDDQSLLRERIISCILLQSKRNQSPSDCDAV